MLQHFINPAHQPFLARLPELRRVLASDVMPAYEGSRAAVDGGAPA